MARVFFRVPKNSAWAKFLWVKLCLIWNFAYADSFTYGKVPNWSQSCLVAPRRIFRLVIKGLFDVYLIRPFEKKLILFLEQCCAWYSFYENKVLHIMSAEEGFSEVLPCFHEMKTIPGRTFLRNYGVLIYVSFWDCNLSNVHPFQWCFKNSWARTFLSIILMFQ